MADFKLSASLKGHERDVRAVAFPSANAVISASRDSTVRLWTTTSTSPPTYDGSISSQSEASVNAVAYLPTTPNFPDGWVISGGSDTIIKARQAGKDLEKPAERLLLGHTNNVCALDVDRAGKFIVSGGWDHQAMVWTEGSWECDAILGGHGNSVLAVLAFDSDTIITGCADHYIRVFHVSKELTQTTPPQTIETEIKGDCKDIVRALCRVPKSHPFGADFASASNDGVIRFWKIKKVNKVPVIFKGKPIRRFQGHEKFIYSLAALSSGEIISSGEDRTVRIWKGKNCLQTITFPELSVWGVAACAENDEIVAGTSDNIVRVFSRHPERIASKESVNEFEDSVKNYRMKVEEKPDYLGRKYDFVWEIDIGRKKPIQLPYNLAQNPYEAATMCIQENNLHISSLDNMANLITTNSRMPSIIPQDEYLSITDASFDGMQKKILGLNKSLIDQSKKLNPTELEVLSSSSIPKYLPIYLDHVSFSSISAPSPPIPSGALELALKLCQKWSYADRLPGLDLLRLLAVAPETATYVRPSDEASIIKVLVESVTVTDGNKTPTENYVMMAVRAFTNLFLSAPGRALVLEELGIVRGLVMGGLFVKGSGVSKNRHLLIAVTTLFINYAVLLSTLDEEEGNMKAGKDKARFDEAVALLDPLSKILTQQSDPEVLYRALVAMGTLLEEFGDEMKDKARKKYDLENVVKKVVTEAVYPRIWNVGMEVLFGLEINVIE